MRKKVNIKRISRYWRSVEERLGKDEVARRKTRLRRRKAAEKRGRKICAKCGRSRNTSGDHNVYCNQCLSEYQKEYKRAYRLRKYGLDVASYNLLMESQNGGCAICGGGPRGRCKYLSVDHDHSTGKVRGLLCSRCNSILSLLGDDIKAPMLSKIIEYLGAS